MSVGDSRVTMVEDDSEAGEEVCAMMTAVMKIVEEER